MKKGINKYKIWAFTWILCCLGCAKETSFFSEPYAEGKPALGLVFERTQVPSPANGKPGTVVTLKVGGLQQYQDKAVFRFNGQKAEIQSVSDTEVQVEVPPFASTGITSIVVDDIVVFGPEFDVDGQISIDPTWEAINGTNGSVNNRLITDDGKVIYVGNFTDYNKRGLVRPINRLVRTYQNGTYDVSWRTGEGANGSLNSVVQIGQRYYLAGSFSGYDQKRENISNLTSIYLNGTLDSTGIKPFRRPDQNDTTKYVPTFNGGFNSSVDQLYVQGTKIIATGNFRYYVNRTYTEPNERETRDTVILDSTEIRQVARLNLDGSLDKSFRFTGGKALEGGNGNLRTLLHESGALQGKILVYGQFSRFDGQTLGYITRLNSDGTIDPTFNPGGIGANHYISSVTFNPQTNKYVIVGQFRTYNGNTALRMALLNADGTLDNSFEAQVFTGGYPAYAIQLNDGLIVTTGGFMTYGDVSRNGFMVLNADGTLAEDLNATGQFRGSINKIIETTSEDGKRALLLMGSFSKFDNEDVGNIIRVIIE
ncbi:DUF5008 domain-containing protein [Sphingobacterium sp. LRF_L2]|uniref:DUF5008 domain-containing protein n=1 Tax=Sphingobacterium sp. LRF_L2 TaxID=3369421 RepID=UPI003F610656